MPLMINDKEILKNFHIRTVHNWYNNWIQSQDILCLYSLSKDGKPPVRYGLVWDFIKWQNTAFCCWRKLQNQSSNYYYQSSLKHLGECFPSLVPRVLGQWKTKYFPTFCLSTQKTKKIQKHRNAASHICQISREPKYGFCTL